MEQKQKKNTDDFIFGIRAVIEAVNSGKDLDKVMIKRGLKGELVKELFDVLKENDIIYQTVPEEKLNRFTRKNHQGVIALISPITFYELEELVSLTFEKGVTPFFMMLDGVSDVRNFGALVRSAECSGVHGIIIPEKGSARIGPDAVKTSAGALFKVPVCKTGSIKKAIQYMQNCGIRVFGASEKTESTYFSEKYIDPVCMVMGSEDVGISDEALRTCDQLVKIPILGEIESLNVSVAASVLMYEVVRQRMNDN